MASEYQLIIPAEEVAPSITVPLPHVLPGVVLIIEGGWLTVAVTAVLLAVEQPLSVAST